MSDTKQDPRQTPLDAAALRKRAETQAGAMAPASLSAQTPEANLTAATLLDVNRGALVKLPWTRFILKEDQDLRYARL